MLRSHPFESNEIVAVGIPVGHVGEYPSAPESAINYAASQTGKRVSEMPELITPLPTDGPPQLARWRLELDNAATLRSASGERKTREVFVGPVSIGGKGVAVLVATPTQPASVDLHWAPMPQIGETLSSYRARAHRQISRLVRRLDTPVQVEPISVREGR